MTKVAQDNQNSKDIKRYPSEREVIMSGLQGYQAEALLSQAKVKVMLNSRQSGKAVCLDTMIPTPDGFVKMGDIKKGDKVFGHDGRIVNVIYTSPVYEGRKCYEI